MSEPRLRFNVQTGEFECSGSEQFIKESRAEFKELLLDLATAKRAQGRPSGTDTPSKDASPLDTEPGADAPGTVPDEYRDIFAADAEGGFRLQTLPTDSSGTYERMADAMMILLWAYNKFSGQDTAWSGTVASNLRRSGAGDVANLKRAVKILQKQHWITKSGFKRGVRYGLTSKGVGKAGEIVAALVAKTR